jgi:hypothetical protein
MYLPREERRATATLRTAAPPRQPNMNNSAAKKSPSSSSVVVTPPDTIDEKAKAQDHSSKQAFRVFAIFWAVMHFVDLLIATFIWINAWDGWVIAALSTLVLFMPDSLLAFTAMTGASAIRVINMMPFVVNHLLLMLQADIVILIASVYAVIVSHLRPNNTKDIDIHHQKNPSVICFQTFAPALRLQMVATYLLTVVHKMNWDFLNPKTSCASLLFQQMLMQFNIVEYDTPINNGALLAVIYGTLLVETLIPVLLMIPKTRYTGLVLGALFHFGLGLHVNPGICSFSSQFLAYLSLFLSTDALGEVCKIGGWPGFGRASQTRTLLRRFLPPMWLVIPLGFFVVLYGRIELRNQIGKHRRTAPQTADLFKTLHDSIFHVYWIACTVWLISAMIMPSKGRKNIHATIAGELDFTIQNGSRSKQKTIKKLPLALLAFMMMNFAKPYIGGPTHGCYHMFANLRTERNPNHLFLPTRHFLPYQDDMVKVVLSRPNILQPWVNPNSLQQWKVGNHRILTMFELRRLVRQYQGPITLQLQFANGTEEVATRNQLGATNSTSGVFDPPGYWENKLVWNMHTSNFDGPTVCDGKVARAGR